jgi:hypothetical protein
MIYTGCVVVGLWIGFCLGLICGALLHAAARADVQYEQAADRLRQNRARRPGLSAAAGREGKRGSDIPLSHSLN